MILGASIDLPWRRRRRDYASLLPAVGQWSGVLPLAALHLDLSRSRISRVPNPCPCHLRFPPLLGAIIRRRRRLLVVVVDVFLLMALGSQRCVALLQLSLSDLQSARDLSRVEASAFRFVWWQPASSVSAAPPPRALVPRLHCSANSGSFLDLWRHCCCLGKPLELLRTCRSTPTLHLYSGIAQRASVTPATYCSCPPSTSVLHLFFHCPVLFSWRALCSSTTSWASTTFGQGLLDLCLRWASSG